MDRVRVGCGSDVGRLCAGCSESLELERHYRRRCGDNGRAGNVSKRPPLSPRNSRPAAAAGADRAVIAGPLVSDKLPSSGRFSAARRCQRARAVRGEGEMILVARDDAEGRFVSCRVAPRLPPSANVAQCLTPAAERPAGNDARATTITAPLEEERHTANHTGDGDGRPREGRREERSEITYQVTSDNNEKYPFF